MVRLWEVAVVTWTGAGGMSLASGNLLAATQGSCAGN
jgi:hypothetical protein